MLIDSRQLAYETFQGCRHSWAGNEALFTLLIPMLDEASEKGVLVLEVPESRIEALRPHERARIEQVLESEPLAFEGLTESSHRLLDLCHLAAVELKELWVAGAFGPVRSLGYAMHPVPSLIASGERFDPEQFQFNFRVAAYHWLELSLEIQRALAGAVGLGMDRADKLALSKGFAVKI